MPNVDAYDYRDCPSEKCHGRRALYENGRCVHCGCDKSYGEVRDLSEYDHDLKQMRERNERGRKARWRGKAPVR